MSQPVRVQLSRRKGWRMPSNTVRVARPGRFGNPYVASLFGGDRQRVVELFRMYLDHENGAEMLAAVKRVLRGTNLACWCPLDQPCHADVLLEIANR